jgi:thioredoxin 1
MKKILRNPMTIVFLFFATVLIGSNFCCTGKASNNEKQNLTSVDQTIATSTEPATGAVQSLTASTFDENVKSGIVLVDFWATWCKPCKMQSPIMEEVNTEMIGKASVYKIDIDQNPSIADRYNVQSIPTIIIFKDGKAVSQFIGVTQKSDIISAIEKFTASK